MSTLSTKIRSVIRRLLSSKTVKRHKLTAASIDLDSPEVAQDPFNHFEILRRDGPVQYLAQHNFWIVLGYEEVKQAFKDHQSFSTSPYEAIDTALLSATAAQHAQIRRLISDCFAPDALARLSLSAEKRCAQLIKPSFDAVGDYAIPLASHIAAELIGFSAESQDAVLQAAANSRSGQTTFDVLLTTLDGEAEQTSLYKTLKQGDVDAISDDHARSLVRLFWLAATATTERVIAWGILLLLQLPELRASLQDPEQQNTFIDEVLRLHPPEHMFPRMTTTAIQLGGIDIPAGALVNVCVSAANRDATVFDDPHNLKMDRPANRHVSFGYGIHRCVGAILAKQVTTTALQTLLREAPNLHVVNSADILYWANKNTFAPRYLPVNT